jgi:hypothetical protein
MPGVAADVVIRDADAGDAAGIAEQLTELGWPTEPGAVPERLERLRRAGGRALVAVRGADVRGTTNP